jgi:hypothetical protein
MVREKHADLPFHPSSAFGLFRTRRTILKEAEQHVGSKYVDRVLDSLYVIETAMRHFFIRAEMGKNAGRKKEEVDEDYKKAAALAALVAPYRRARLSAVKLAGDPNNPVRFNDNATADELRRQAVAIGLAPSQSERKCPVGRDHAAAGDTDVSRPY